MQNSVYFEIDFYDSEHEQLLRDQCPEYPQLQKLVNGGFRIDKNIFFSYAMFVEQKLGRHGWETYRELLEKLPGFLGAWEENFDFSGNSVNAKFLTSEIRICHKESMGVGGALSVVSKVYNLTEADWETIPITQVRDLDFLIASTGSKYIEVEAKGSVVPNHLQQHISHHQTSIKKKKITQREEEDNNNTLIGVITSIPENSEHNAKCWILDPPSVSVPMDPYKYKLLARLYYYWRELSMLSRSHFLEVLINRIQTIANVEDYKSLTGLPLLNRRGKPHGVPESLFDKRSSVIDRKAFGETIPLDRYGDKFFFYGFDTSIVKSLLKQDFGKITNLNFTVGIESNVKISAKIPKYLLKIDREERDDYQKEDESRKEIEMIGDLVHTSCGRVWGLARSIS